MRVVLVAHEDTERPLVLRDICTLFADVTSDVHIEPADGRDMHHEELEIGRPPCSSALPERELVA
jgi:hypothetical protein